jgi:flavin reductase (DIM6/NTAB) family NADH-FMN oxidoreductase RutF
VIVNPVDLKPVDVYKLMTAIIVPRPIALVSTVGPDGILNLAPYSFFTGICYHPPTVCFSAIRREGEKKDTVRNVEATGEFVVNVVHEGIAEEMNATSAEFPSEIDEFEVARLTPVRSDLVRPPRVGESPVSMECRLSRVLELGEAPYGASLVIGEVVRFHVRDDLYLGDGKVDVAKLGPVGRLVGDLYCHTGDIFAMKRPQYKSAV